MTVSRNLRYQVLRRDQFTCQYCGGRAPDVALTVDHVVPAALGGPDTPDNLTTACRDCNGGKAATPPDAAHVAAVSDKHRQWAAAMAQLAAEAADQRTGSDWFIEEWNSYTCGTAPGEGDPPPLPPAWDNSVQVWTARGLTRGDIAAAIGIAMGRRNVAHEEVFRYMAGICWSMLRDREDQASRRLDGGQ